MAEIYDFHRLMFSTGSAMGLLSIVIDSWAGPNKPGLQAAAELLVVAPTEGLHKLQTPNCNDSQSAAVKAAASKTLTLIHGPPGTGKVPCLPPILPPPSCLLTLPL